MLVRAAQLREFNLESSLVLSRFFIRGDRLMDAAKLLEKLDAAGGQNAELHYLLSIVYRRLGYLERAVERMNGARALDPGNAQYEAELGRLMVKQGKIYEALEILTRALENDQSLVEAYVGFGELFYASGQTADAVRSYQSALARDAGNRDALLGRARLYAPSSPALAAPERDSSAITGVAPDTAIYYLTRYSANNGPDVSAQRAPLLLDSLRGIQR